MHILCCINFYHKDDSFAENDIHSLDIVTGLGIYDMVVFLQRPYFRFIRRGVNSTSLRGLMWVDPLMGHFSENEKKNSEKCPPFCYFCIHQKSYDMRYNH